MEDMKEGAGTEQELIKRRRRKDCKGCWGAMAKVGEKKPKQYVEIESKENRNCVNMDVVIGIKC